LAVGLLTGRSSSVVDVRAKELKIPPDLVVQGEKIKLPAFERLLKQHALQADEVLFMGDDLVDLPVLERAGMACCPAAAHPDVVRICHFAARRGGGLGAVRDVCEHFMQARKDGTWERAVARYLGRA
jgi:3-deoxy-D-manno-octulosonate 8-phosphate phosphatase (KDO 8-P phosphatase)